ncbi:MAG: hypothetical protein E7487_00710 [Ruminococcaceae bacterium]|nr:hypothetical protein [Oscillospiraceae bacterium]
MKNKRLLRIIGEIEDEYILEAMRKTGRKMKWLQMGIIAAGIMIVLAAGAVFFESRELPVLNINYNQEEGMGIEGYFAHSIDELQNNNPWNGERIEKLPVYRNTFYEYTKEWMVTEPDTKKMRQLLKEAAAALKMNTEQIEIKENIPEGYPAIYSYYAEDPNYKIDVNAWLNVNIEVKKKEILPEEYTLYSYASYDELQESARYLGDLFSDLLGMKEPAVDISMGDYTVDGTQFWKISFYESEGDERKQIQSYHFGKIYFYGDEEGNLSSISYSRGRQEEKIGDYPIIAVKEAVHLLEEGKYISSVTESFPGKEAVEKIELVYRTEMNESVFIPYYKFYVKLEEREIKEQDLKCFGAFYVPAIEEKYIADMVQ